MNSQEYYLNQENSQCNHILPKKHDKFLLKDNYLGEFYTEEEKAQARSNLGIDPELELLKRIIDNYIDKNSEDARYLVFDKLPISGNYNHILSSDSLYKAFRNYYTVEEIDNKLRELQPFSVDSELSGQSENPVQNKVLKEAFDSLYEGVMHLLNTKLNNYYTKELLENTILETTESIIERIPSEVSQSIINITWLELKDLRDNGQLIPGQLYRIVDYVTTVRNDGIYEEARSAGHLFDIIVIADSESVLNENARAALHANDTYFIDNNLEGWKLKYCLDNNTDRCSWADTINGKGVIYEMEDEFGNVVAYDFKNILFKLYKVLDTLSRDEINGKYVGLNQYKVYPNQDDLGYSFIGRSITINEDDYAWCYTFSSNSSQKELEDSSLNKSGASVQNNIIESSTNTLSFSVIFSNSRSVLMNKLFLCGAVISSGRVMFNNMSVWRSIICGLVRANNINEIVLCCITSSWFFENTILGLYFSEILGEFQENLCMMIRSCVIGNAFCYNRICQMVYCKVGNSFTRNETESLIICCSFSNYVERNNFRGPIKFLEIKKDYFSGNIIESVLYLTIDSNLTTSSEARLLGIKVCTFCNHSENITEKLLVLANNPNITAAEISVLRFSLENFPPKGAQEETLRKIISHDSVLDTSLTEYKSIESRTVLI